MINFLNRFNSLLVGIKKLFKEICQTFLRDLIIFYKKCYGLLEYHRVDLSDFMNIFDRIHAKNRQIWWKNLTDFLETFMRFLKGSFRRHEKIWYFSLENVRDFLERFNRFFREITQPSWRNVTDFLERMIYILERIVKDIGKIILFFFSWSLITN